jgi:hypothetical protein
MYRRRLWIRRTVKKAKNDSSGKRGSAPMVGIFYFVRGKLLIEGSLLSEGESYGSSITHARAHTTMWSELIEAGQVLRAPYEENPRGRVNYHRDTERFTLMADWCIRNQNGLIAEIMKQLHLPKGRTDVRSDSITSARGVLPKSGTAGEVA